MNEEVDGRTRADQSRGETGVVPLDPDEILFEVYLFLLRWGSSLPHERIVSKSGTRLRPEVKSADSEAGVSVFEGSLQRTREGSVSLPACDRSGNDTSFDDAVLAKAFTPRPTSGDAMDEEEKLTESKSEVYD